MNKLLIVYGTLDQAQRWRCQHLSEQLRIAGIGCDLLEFRQLSFAHSDRYSAVIFHRVQLDARLRAITQRIRQQGALVFYDTDDLNFDSAIINSIRSIESNDWLRKTLYRNEAHRCAEMLALSDAAITTTAYLKDRIERTGRPAWIHRNAFSPAMLRLADEALRGKSDVATASDKVILGYASGTPTHNYDFAVIAAALRTVLDRFQQTELWIIGHLQLDETWHHLAPRIRRLPFVSWQKLPELLADFDINLAPLESDNPFCQAKSEIKFVEAALVQVPTIATATDAFKFAIRQGETGWLASTEQEWTDGLTRLIASASLRHSIGVKARADALARYHPETRARELKQLLNDIHLQTKGTAPECWETSSEPAHQFATPPLFSSLRPSLCWRVWYALRYRGLKLTLLQALLYWRNRF